MKIIYKLLTDYPLTLAQWRKMLDGFEDENGRVPEGEELMEWLIDSPAFRVEMLSNIARGPASFQPRGLFSKGRK